MLTSVRASRDTVAVLCGDSRHAAVTDASARELARSRAPVPELEGAEARAILEFRRMTSAMKRSVDGEVQRAHSRWVRDHPDRAIPEQRIRGALTRGRAKFRKAFPDKRVQEILSKNAAQVTGSAKRLFARETPKSVSDRANRAKLDGPASKFVNAGRRLMRKVEKDYARDVAKQVRGVQTGKVLASKLKKRGDVLRNRADLIAIDQTHSAHSSATRALYRRAGIERYTWVTQGDDDVRDEHEARNGQTFAWDAPPPDGHPGEPINCRCFPVTVTGDGERAADELAT